MVTGEAKSVLKLQDIVSGRPEMTPTSEILGSILSSLQRYWFNSASLRSTVSLALDFPGRYVLPGTLGRSSPGKQSTSRLCSSSNSR